MTVNYQKLSIESFFNKASNLFNVDPQGVVRMEMRVPHLFKAEKVFELRDSTLMRMIRLSGQGRTENERRHALAQKMIAQAVPEDISMAGEPPFPARVLFLYHAKGEQNPYKIKDGQIYENIGMYNRKHDHNDPNLFDLQIVDVSTMPGHVRLIHFNRHTHIYVPDERTLAW